MAAAAAANKARTAGGDECRPRKRLGQAEAPSAPPREGRVALFFSKERAAGRGHKQAGACVCGRWGMGYHQIKSTLKRGGGQRGTAARAKLKSRERRQDGRAQFALYMGVAWRLPSFSDPPLSAGPAVGNDATRGLERGGERRAARAAPAVVHKTGVAYACSPLQLLRGGGGERVALAKHKKNQGRRRRLLEQAMMAEAKAEGGESVVSLEERMRRHAAGRMPAGCAPARRCRRTMCWGANGAARRRGAAVVFGNGERSVVSRGEVFVVPAVYFVCIFQEQRCLSQIKA